MIELRAGNWRCEVDPALGGAVTGLWLGTVPVLRSMPAGQAPGARQAACLPIVPFSNRIGHAAVTWQGTQQPMVRHPGDAPNAILGLGAQRAWEMLDQDDASLMLAYEHRADASWPFAFDCSHTLRLQSSGLDLSLAVTNQSREAAPLGLGWRALVSRRAGSQLVLRASGEWELDAEQHPAVRRASKGFEGDAGSVAGDHCFDGWDGLAELRDARLAVRVRSGLTRVVLCAGGGPDLLAIEPASHVPNAVHRYAMGAPANDLGLALLQPGESLIAQLRIEAEVLA